MYYNTKHKLISHAFMIPSALWIWAMIIMLSLGIIYDCGNNYFLKCFSLENILNNIFFIFKK